MTILEAVKLFPPAPKYFTRVFVCNGVTNGLRFASCVGTCGQSSEHLAAVIFGHYEFETREMVSLCGFTFQTYLDPKTDHKAFVQLA